MSTEESNPTPPQGEDALTRATDRGMMPVYAMTKFFLETVIDPRSLVVMSKKVDLTDWRAIVHSLQYDWELWVDHYYEFFICVVLAVAISIAMVVVGVSICTCRCHGKCGGNINKKDDRNTVYKRRCCTIALSSVLVALMLGTVALFIGNQLAYEETSKDGLAYTFHDSLGRLTSFQRDTTNSYDTLIADDFKKATHKMTENLGQFAELCQNKVDERTQFSEHFGQLEKYVHGLNKTKHDLMRIEELSADMSSLSEMLEDELLVLKENMTSDLELCREDNTYCEMALQQVEDLEVLLNASHLIGATQDSIDAIDDVTSGDETIYDGLQETMEEYKGIRDSIDETASDQIKVLLTATNEFNVEVHIFINLTTVGMNAMSFTSAQNYVNQSLGPWIKTAGDIRYFSCVAIGCLIIIMTVLYCVALAYGTFGERPNQEARCCNRGNSASLLMTTAYLTLAFSSIFMLATSLFVVPGGIVHTDICRHLVTLEDKAVLDVMDEIIRGYIDMNISASQSYQNCQEDQTIYTAADVDQLGPELNISEIVNKEMSAINKELAALKMLNYTASAVTLLNNVLDRSLTTLADDLHQLDLSEHYVQTQSNITSIDLKAFAAFLADAAENSHELNDVFMSYSNVVQSVYEDYILDISAMQDELNENVEQASSFINTTSPLDMIDQLNKTQTSLNDDVITSSVHDVTDKFQGDFKSMSEHLEKQVRKDVGNCESLYNAVADGITETCVFFLYPFNGFWFCLGWCIFFLTLTVPIAIVLAGYYEKTKKYTKMDIPGLTFEPTYASVPSVHRQRTKRKGPGPPATMDVTQLEFEMMDVDSYEQQSRHSDNDLDERWNKAFNHADDDGGFREYHSQPRHRRQLSASCLDDDILYASTFNPDLVQECVAPNGMDLNSTMNLGYRANSNVYDSPILLTPPGEGPDPYTPYVNDDLNFQYDNPGYAVQIPEPQIPSTGLTRTNVNAAYF